jgi:hypothetical protein
MTKLPQPSVADAITSPLRYRESRPGLEGFRLVSATVHATLSPCCLRARYEYECHLETTGPVPARYWCYHVPADAAEVDDLRAWDGRGKLTTRLYSGDGPGARVEVRLREPVRAGERYGFGFGYDSAIRPIVAAERGVRTVTYSDWVIFNIPCDRLQVQVTLPPRAALISAIPACAEAEDGRVTYRVRALRPLESVAFAIAFRIAPPPRPGSRWARALRIVRPV